MLNLIDKKVTHKSFGVGRIVKFTDSSIEINFEMGNKLFVFPSVFAQHLQIHDSEDAEIIGKMIEEMDKVQEEEEFKKQEEKRIHLQKQQLRMDYEKIMYNHKLHNESQVAFWCDEDEQQSVFNNWTVFSGVVKSGNNKGNASKLNRIHQNSAIVLTARDSDVPEQERRILGLYMIKKNLIGKLMEEGKIPAHTTYRIQLTEKESDKLFFWNYYTNKKSPEKMSWNTGKYRYFENAWTAQILIDILKLKEDPQEKEQVQQFLNHFCKMNQLSIEDIEIPTGVLLQ